MKNQTIKNALPKQSIFVVIQFKLEVESGSGNFDEVGDLFDPKA